MRFAGGAAVQAVDHAMSMMVTVFRVKTDTRQMMRVVETDLDVSGKARKN